jgi:hypothetical protein
VSASGETPGPVSKWNNDIEKITIGGPFAVGTTFTMTAALLAMLRPLAHRSDP